MNALQDLIGKNGDYFKLRDYSSERWNELKEGSK